MGGDPGFMLLCRLPVRFDISNAEAMPAAVTTCRCTMQVVRRAGAKLHLRVPAVKAVRECAARIEGLEGDIAAIQAQERQEMELRRAEMQATKVGVSRGACHDGPYERLACAHCIIYGFVTDLAAVPYVLTCKSCCAWFSPQRVGCRLRT